MWRPRHAQCHHRAALYLIFCAAVIARSSCTPGVRGMQYVKHSVPGSTLLGCINLAMLTIYIRYARHVVTWQLWKTTGKGCQLHSSVRSYAGVFDGHGAADAAELTACRMHKLLAEELGASANE